MEIKNISVEFQHVNDIAWKTSFKTTFLAIKVGVLTTLNGQGKKNTWIPKRN